VERERRRRARARVGWAGVDDGSRPRGCELPHCTGREQQSSQEREEDGKEETAHVAGSPFRAGSVLGVGGGTQDPSHSPQGRTPVTSAKAMMPIPGPGSSARGGTTTDFPLCLQARSRGIPRYNLRVGKYCHAGSPDPNGWHRVPTQPPARSWGTGITVNRPLNRDPCPPHGGVRGHLVHEEWGGEPGDNPVLAVLTRCASRGERGRAPRFKVRPAVARSSGSTQRASRLPLTSRASTRSSICCEWASA
jgi:hypothetical protein